MDAAWPNHGGRRAGGAGGNGGGGAGVGGGGLGGGFGGIGGIAAVVERGDESSWDADPAPRAPPPYSLRGFSPPPPPPPPPPAPAQPPHPHAPPNRFAVAQGRHQQPGSLQARGPWRVAPPPDGGEDEQVYDHKRGWRKRGRWRQPPQQLARSKSLPVHVQRACAISCSVV